MRVGSDAEQWPTDLGSEFLKDYNCGSPQAQFSDPACPSAGYQPLPQHYLTWWEYSTEPFRFELLDDNILKMIYVQPASCLGCETWVWTAHASTATLQNVMRDSYVQAINGLADKKPFDRPFPQRLLWGTSLEFSTPTRLPMVRTVCLPQDGVDFRKGNIRVKFPRLEEYDTFWDLESQNYSATSMDITDETRKYLYKRALIPQMDATIDDGIFNNAGSMVIVPVNIWDHTASSLGLVLLLKNIQTGEADAGTGSNVMTCSVDARWASGSSIMQMAPTDQVASDIATGRIRSVVTGTLDTENSDDLGALPVPPSNDGTLTMIRLQPDWYDMFAPVAPEEALVSRYVPDLGNMARPTLERILEILNFFSRTWTTIEDQTDYKNRLVASTVVSTLVADSLSRCGAASIPDLTKVFGEWPAFDWNDETIARKMVRRGMPEETYSKPTTLLSYNTTKQTMTASFSGFAQSTNSLFDYISVGILSFHAALALAYTIRMVYRAETYRGLHSILELTALALKSEQPVDPILRNTWAGIKTFRTVRTLAYLEAAAPNGGDGEDGGDVQLRVEPVNAPRKRVLSLQPDVEY